MAGQRGTVRREGGGRGTCRGSSSEQEEETAAKPHATAGVLEVPKLPIDGDKFLDSPEATGRRFLGSPVDYW